MMFLCAIFEIVLLPDTSMLLQQCVMGWEVTVSWTVVAGIMVPKDVCSLPPEPVACITLHGKMQC